MRAVLDASALVAYFREEPAAEEVEHLLRRGTGMSVVNGSEVVDSLVRIGGRAHDDVVAALLHLVVDGRLVLHDVTTDRALRAGRLRAVHYSRRQCPVSLADCVAAVTALELEAPLATADAFLADVVAREGGQLLALPNSRGRRPGEPS